MKSLHTPGPWFADASFVGSEAIDRFFVSCHSKDLPGGRDEAEANARLIAAAPELLDALRAVSDDLRDLLLQRMSPEMAQALPSLEAARAAIKQATGQEEPS